MHHRIQLGMGDVTVRGGKPTLSRRDTLAITKTFLRVSHVASHDTEPLRDWVLYHAEASHLISLFELGLIERDLYSVSVRTIWSPSVNVHLLLT